MEWDRHKVEDKAEDEWAGRMQPVRVASVSAPNAVTECRIHPANPAIRRRARNAEPQ